MRILRMLGVAVTVCLLAGSAMADGEQPAKEEAAKRTAQAWLELVDGKSYDQSWETAGSLLRGAMPKEQWAQTIGGVRSPLGGLVSRNLLSAQYASELPGAPDGEYFIIQYQTTFENKRSAVETTTLMREQDQSWKVTGYFIK